MLYLSFEHQVARNYTLNQNWLVVWNVNCNLKKKIYIYNVKNLNYKIKKGKLDQNCLECITYCSKNWLPKIRIHFKR